MLEFSKLVSKEPKSLPLFLMLDVSGSMSVDSKIETLNTAVKNMLKELAECEVDIRVGIITFGNTAEYFMPLTSAMAAFELFQDMTAAGLTSMGAACELVKGLIEDKSVVPSRSYRPMLVLLSDGAPTDQWKEPMERLLYDGRSQKCGRIALAVGKQVNKEPLETFVQGQKEEEMCQVYNAVDASGIVRFFDQVTTMTKTQAFNYTHQNVKPSVDKRPEVVAEPEPEEIYPEAAAPASPAAPAAPARKNVSSKPAPMNFDSDDGIW